MQNIIKILFCFTFLLAFYVIKTFKNIKNVKRDKKRKRFTSTVQCMINFDFTHSVYSKLSQFPLDSEFELR